MDTKLKSQGTHRTGDKRSLTLILVLTITVVVSIICIALIWFQNQKLHSAINDQRAEIQSLEAKLKESPIQNNDQSATPANTNTKQKVAPKHFLLGLKKRLQKDYELIPGGSASSLGEDQVSYGTSTHSYNAPSFKLDGYDFYTDAEDGSSMSLSVGSSVSRQSGKLLEADRKLRENIIDFYKSQGMSKITHSSSSQLYKNDHLVCAVNGVDSMSWPTIASCGSLDGYTKNAKTISPFAMAMPVKNFTYRFNNLQISNSRTTGYQIASIEIGNASSDASSSLAYLYKKDGVGWKFFTNTHSVLGCSEYTTQELKEAFLGKECYGGAGVVTL